MEFLTFSFSNFLTAIHVIFVVVFWVVILFFGVFFIHTLVNAISLMIFAKRTDMKSKDGTFLRLCLACWDSAWQGHHFGSNQSNNYWYGIGDWRYYDFKNRKYVYGVSIQKRIKNFFFGNPFRFLCFIYILGWIWVVHRFHYNPTQENLESVLIYTLDVMGFGYLGWLMNDPR